MAGERAGAVDHLGLALEHRAQQRRQVLRRVLEVGVAHDHVRAGGLGRRGPDRRALAAVDRVGVHRHPRVVEPGQQRGGAVRAAVVDDDQLDVARVGHVEHPLDDDLDGLGLVEDRHEDRQLHCAPSRLADGVADPGDGRLETVLQRHRRLPAERGPGQRDVRLAHGRVVLRPRHELDRRRPSRPRPGSARPAPAPRARRGLPMLTGPVEVGGGEPEDAVDQVVDVADRRGSASRRRPPSSARRPAPAG